MSPCRSCGANIQWVKTSSGRSMPIDAEPCDDGNIVIRDKVAVYLNKVDTGQPGEQKFKSHFATCPHAAQHRKKS